MTIKKKFIVAGFLLIMTVFALIAFVRFSTPEDTWACTKNGWEKHGNPAGEKPDSKCYNY